MTTSLHFRSRCFNCARLLLLGSLFFAGCACPSRLLPRETYYFPPLELSQDEKLQAGLEAAVRKLGLGRAARESRLAVELVDITDLYAPRAAGINPDTMMYAASLPKILILVALLRRVEEGTLPWDAPTRDLAVQMIRCSSNSAAAVLFHLVGPESIADTALDPCYRLYCFAEGGGLWVGKEYGKSPAWLREPLLDLSHSATAMHVARLYYLLETGRLLSPEQTAVMKEILSNSALDHKFVRGIKSCSPTARIYRKSGSWMDFHSDSALIEHDGRKYIAVALMSDPHGIAWLQALIVELDRLIFETAPPWWCE